MKLKGDRFSECESVLTQGVTRNVAETAGAYGSDIRLIFFKAEPKGCVAGCRASLWMHITYAGPSSSATASSVHQGAPAVREREDLHLEETATSSRLKK